MTTIDDALAAAEPSGPRPLDGLVARLATEGVLRGARLDGRPIGAAGLGGTMVGGGVTHDSRLVRPGGVFVAIAGERADGHDHADEAVARGAAALIVERPLPELAIGQVVVENARRALASAAAWWYGDPSHELTVIGVTGTDGKTTTSYLATAALEAAGVQTGMIGTIATRIGGTSEDHAAHATTPEAPELQAALRAMVASGDQAVVLETTSHGLALERVAAVDYDVAILTNLTHEHLEVHGTWEAYRDAKLRLFERLRLPGPAVPGASAGTPAADGRPRRTGIVNLDDPSAGLFIGVTREAGADLLTYGTEAAADVRATHVAEDADRIVVQFVAPTSSGELDIRLAGRFNVHNALAVVALGEALRLDPAAVRKGIASVGRVPGRMERVDAGQPFTVIVDFAHSPASLQAVLDLVAPGAAARGGGVISVFGSAGERDTAKRPQMGRIAGERSRIVVITDEDPRGEDREAILEAIAGGAESAGKRRGHDLLLIADRRSAIDAAFERARPGDVVLLAGKGHERSIIGSDVERSWDERQAALDALAALGYRA